MVGRNGLEEADRYGLFGWLAGVGLAVLIFVVMFAMSKGYY